MNALNRQYIRTAPRDYSAGVCQRFERDLGLLDGRAWELGRRDMRMTAQCLEYLLKTRTFDYTFPPTQ